MDKFILPEYDNSIVSLASSIRRYFELDVYHNTLSDIDKILEEYKPRNVVVILFDGMGSRLIKKILGENSFLYRNMLKEISSVVPATTTASTTSMLTGLTPVEHGWLAWDLYFKKEDKIVTMFTNKIKDTDIDADSVSLARKYFPYKDICELINEDGKHYAKLIASFNENKYEDIDDMISKIKSSLNIKDKNYIYVYNPEPDTTMHITGTDSKETRDYFELINKKVEELYNTISDDTLLIVVADHGHINCDTVILEDYKDIFNTLDGSTSFEGRLCSFKIKDGREEEFVYLFNKYFSNYFVLMTKEELREAENNFAALYQKKDIDVELPIVEYDSDLVDENGMLSILDCILSTGKYKSKSEIRRLLQQGAVKINGKKTVELLFSPQENMIISVGKGNTFKLMKNKPIVKKIVKI